MHQRFAGKAFILAFLVLILMGQAVAGDQIYVNQTGWWRDGGAFNVSSTPIQAGINNVDAPGSRVTVVDQSEHAYTISFTGGIQNGIFLDLNGSTLNGSAMPGSNGILIDGKNYLSIRNGTVIGFDAGVRIRSTISSSIEQMTIAETGSHAVAITTEDFSGSVQDFLMRDIRIIRPAGSGVRIGGYSNPLNINLTFEGITIDHPGESGIYKHNQQGIRGMTIRNTTIDTPLAYGVLIDNWGQYYRTELSDVTLDNLSVFDPGAQGIVIEQAAIPEAVNLTVRDCHVTNATGNGLFLFGGGRIGLENLTATNCSGYGLHLQSQGAATSINFGTATITGNGNGVRLLNVHNLTLDARQRVADNSGIAFTIEGVGNVTIRDLFSTDALRVPDQGFLIHDADHLTIENATIVNTTLTAVRITPGEYRNGARNLTLRGIRISRPSGHGIHIGGYANGPNIGMTFEDITIDHPLGSGIYKHDQQDMKGVTLRNVSIDTPGGSGVHLDNWGQFYRVELSDVILDKVSVNSSGDTGVNIDKASGRISLDNLTITNCSGYGLQLEPQGATTAVDFGMAHIAGNGNGVWLRNVHNVTIDARRVMDNSGIAFTLDSVGNVTIRDLFSTDTIRVPDRGFLIHEVDNLTIENATMINTTLDAVRITPGEYMNGARNLTLRGIRISRPSGHGIHIGGYANGPNIGMTFENITIDHPLGSGIYKHDQQDMKGVTLRNVSIDTPGGFGVYFDTWGQFYRVELSDVILDKVSVNSSGSTGVNIDKASGRISLDNLTITNCSGYGLQLEPQGATTAVDFGMAHIAGNGNGVWLRNVHNVTIDARRVMDNSGIAFTLDSVGNVTIRDLFSTDTIRVPDRGFLIHEVDNLTIENATIINTTLDAVRITPGEYMNGARNLTLRGIRISRPSGHGIHIGGYANGPNIGMTFENITIDHPLGSGIYKHDQQDMKGVTLRNVSIDTPGGFGVYFDTWGQFYRVELSDVVLDDVLVSNPGSGGITILQQVTPQSINLSVMNCRVLDGESDGMSLIGGGKIVIENNTISGNTNYGLLLDENGITELNFANNTMQNNTKGIQISSIDGDLNESVIQSMNNDISLVSNSLINTFNTSFDKARASVADTSILNVFWFIDLTVVDESLNPVDGAYVTVKNTTGSTVFSGTTDSLGTVPRFALNEYAKNSTTELFHTPFLFHAEKAGETNSTLFDVDRTMAVTLILEPPQPAPVASFTANLTSGNAPLAVQFNDTSLNNPTMWNWSFGDGTWFNTTEGSLRNATRTYLDPGSYTVHLTVSNEGGSDTTLPGTDITVTQPPPPITVLTPNGGEEWQRGTTQTLEWNYSGTPGSSVMIELLQGMEVDTVITPDTSLGSGGFGTYHWTIPFNQTPGSDYRIRISSTSNPAYNDTSNASFSIGPGSPITILSPNGGEQWKQGSTQTLRWNYTGEPGSSVKVEVIKGAIVRVIAPNTSLGSDGSGFLTFTFPYSAPLGSDYLIRVTSTSNTSTTDTSDAPFSIIPPLTVLSPNGGEEWEQGSTQTIRWEYIGDPGPTVKIEALRGDTVLAVISPGTPVGTGGTGSLNLTLPKNAPLGTTYRLRISSTSNALYYDTSDAPFAVVANASSSITLETPNGGETYLQGSEQTIQWKYTGDPGPFVKIEALRNGSVLAVITPSTPIGPGGSGSYNLTFPYATPVGSDYQVRVTSTSNPAWTDTSDGPFAIVPSITVLSPDGGEEWEQGSTHPLTWTYSGNPGTAVKIEALRGDAVLAVITPNTPIGPGMFNLTFPANTPLGNDYRIRITSTTYPGCTDTSDGFFIISAPG